MGNHLERTYYEYISGVPVIHVGEDLKSENPEQMRRLADLAEELAKKKVKAAVVDFQSVGLISSSQLGQVALAYDMLYDNGAEVYLCNTKDEKGYPYKVLKIIGITDFPGVHIKETIDEAVAALSQQ